MAIRSGALHPYSSSVLLSLEQSPAIRMKLKADVMFGVLAAVVEVAPASGNRLPFSFAGKCEPIRNLKREIDVLELRQWQWLQLRTFPRFVHVYLSCSRI